MFRGVASDGVCRDAISHGLAIAARYGHSALRCSARQGADGSDRLGDGRRCIDTASENPSGCTLRGETDMRDPGVGSSGNGVQVAPARAARLGRRAPPRRARAGSRVERAAHDRRGDTAHAEPRPEQAAIVASGLAPLSYRGCRTRSTRSAPRLRQAGFERDARIAVAIADSAEAALAIVAVACSAAAVPIDPKLTFAEVERA